MPGYSQYFDLEWDYAPMPSRQARPVSAPTPAPTVWTAEQIEQAMANHGVGGDWVINYILPAPYPVEDIAVAAELTRQRNGHTELKIMTFHARRNRSGDYLELLQSFSEPEYVSLLRRRHRDVTFYYEAQQANRRRLVAKVLAGGDEVYQLLLGPVVDDEELRLKLRGKFNPLHTSKSKAFIAAKRMNQFRKEKAEAAIAGVTTLNPPESERGQRAQTANHRRRDNDQRRRNGSRLRGT